ncbi:MAG TPA: substrate-binding domain-containing protein [Steroidobacteraceae bacterium]|nr:substrate-binding domain-containing protein [Steroidobacteraceae bacterium]
MNPTSPGPRPQLLACAGLAAMLALPADGIADDAADQRPVVRLAAVNTPYQSGLLASLLPDFEKASGYRVELYGGSDVYRQAELGNADILISHYGKAPVEEFVTSGKGTWPRPVFSNQSVLVGPASDPAKIRGMTDPFEAMRKIVASGSHYVAPSYPVGRYLSELLLAGAGDPERGSWYTESREPKGRAMQFAEQKGAYTIWGSFPFERFRRRHGTSLEVMVFDTPVFHRLMAVIRVSPERFTGVNSEGARALEAYLLSPATQAAIAAFREEGMDKQTWWPAAIDNNPSQLLGLGGDEDED